MTQRSENTFYIFDESRKSGNLVVTPSSLLIGRIQKLKYLKETQEGKLRMSPLQNYRKLEKTDKCGRLDENEGSILNPPQSQECDIIFNGKVGAKVKGIHISAYIDTPIICFTRINPIINESRVNYGIDFEIIKNFITDPEDEYGLLIIDYEMFGKRCQEHLDSMGEEWQLKPVTYSDNDPIDVLKTYLPDVLFQKRNMYAYQHEVRLWVNKNVEEPYYLNIGDISDISVLYPIGDKP